MSRPGRWSQRAAAAAWVMLAGFIVPSRLCAEQPSRVEGHVRDEITGRPLARAVVEIAGTRLRTRTDSLGAYHLDGVSAGLLSLRASADRYTASVQPLAVE